MAEKKEKMMSEPTGKTITCKCKWCGDPFTAKVADRKRGWARHCSKSCAAKTKAKQTGRGREWVENYDHWRYTGVGS